MMTLILLIAINCYIGFVTFIIGRKKDEVPNTYFHLVGITLLGAGALFLMILSKLEAKYEPGPIQSKKDYISIAFIIITGAIILTIVVLTMVMLMKSNLHVNTKVIAAVITGFISSFATKYLISWLNKLSK